MVLLVPGMYTEGDPWGLLRQQQISLHHHSLEKQKNFNKS